MKIIGVNLPQSSIVINIDIARFFLSIDRNKILYCTRHRVKWLETKKKAKITIQGKKNECKQIIKRAKQMWIHVKLEGIERENNGNKSRKFY